MSWAFPFYKHKDGEGWSLVITRTWTGNSPNSKISLGLYWEGRGPLHEVEGDHSKFLGMLKELVE